MTFYQELQLNQAGSKNLLKKSETVKEKSYHILVYLVKIAVTMAFCFLFVTIFSILFGNENSIVGVVVLLCLMVFRNKGNYMGCFCRNYNNICCKIYYKKVLKMA